MRAVIFCLLFLANLEAHMMHFPFQELWKEENLPPFDELMLTWNAKRPQNGKFHFYVRVKTEEWSPWLLYATWGSGGQSSYQTTGPVKVYQDALEVTEGKKATAFQIKAIAEEGASLEDIHGLHVYTNGDKVQEWQVTSYPDPISLEVAGLSQMTVEHPRFMDLCSPVSTTAATRYLSQERVIDPAVFAQNAWDSGFDIYGNWVFNMAESYTHLGAKWSCWVERLNGFDPIYQHLSQGMPVIVSVRGPLAGSALPYAKGHLMAVIGYDPVEKRVKCMDPAFPKDSETLVYYDFTDFMQAWSRRGNIAYVFEKK